MEQAEIQKYRHDLEVVRDTAAQVIKDFGLAGFSINFSGSASNAYSELFEQAMPVLRGLYDTNPGAFMALLYRIDVEEKKVKELQLSFSKENYFRELTTLVLEREFIKVLFRKLFKHLDG